MLLPLLAVASHGPVPGPASIPPLPDARQLEWHSRELYAFAHFGPNTFTGEEWGSGKERPEVFNPTEFDPDQWATELKAAGFTGLIITAKHHDGFCLWPSSFSKHTVAQSAWKSGKGDVLKDLSAALKRHGLWFGVYLSPWDRNHPTYGTSDYNRIFAGMLEEVLTKYGDVREVWFDGANGEGPNGRRQVYDWPLFVSTVRRFAPHAVIFSDAGPDIRWVGNESGEAGETCWPFLNRDKFYPGIPNVEVKLNQGEFDGHDWLPAECDVSIRPGWFWRASENAKVKQPMQLWDIYLKSVGRGANLLLNVPPDALGKLHKEDCEALIGFKRLRDRAFERDLARTATASSPKWRAQFPDFSPERTIDGKDSTYWSLNDSDRSGEVALRWQRPIDFDLVELREDIRIGQRVKAFSVEVWKSGAWTVLYTGTTLGRRRLISFPRVRTDHLRVRILDSRAAPVLSRISVYDSGL